MWAPGSAPSTTVLRDARSSGPQRQVRTLSTIMTPVPDPLLRPQQNLKTDIGDPLGLPVNDVYGPETAAAHQQQVQRLALVQRLASAQADGGFGLLWRAGGEYSDTLPWCDAVGILQVI